MPNKNHINDLAGELSKLRPEGSFTLEDHQNILKYIENMRYQSADSWILNSLKKMIISENVEKAWVFALSGEPKYFIELLERHMIKILKLDVYRITHKAFKDQYIIFKNGEVEFVQFF